MGELDPLKQKLQIEVEFDENKLGKAIDILDTMGKRAENATEGTKKAAKETSDFSKLISDDLSGAFGKVKGALGPFAELLGTGGAITGGVVVFNMLDKAVSDMEKTLTSTNQQFVGYKQNLKDIAGLTKDLTFMGVSGEAGSALINQLSKSSAFKDAEQLQSATRASASMSGTYGVPLSDMATMISNLTKAGTEFGGIPGKDIGSETAKRMSELQKESVEKGFSSMDQYVKSFNELWQTTRNVNMTFEATERVLASWSEEVRRGVFTAKEMGDFAGGKNMNDASKVMMAQQLGYSGSPLEMITQLEKHIGKGGIDKELRDKIIEMTKGLSGSHDEQIQLAAKISDMLGGPKLDTLQKKEAFWSGLKDQRTPEEKERLSVSAEARSQSAETVEGAEKRATERYHATTTMLEYLKDAATVTVRAIGAHLVEGHADPKYMAEERAYSAVHGKNLSPRDAELKSMAEEINKGSVMQSLKTLTLNQDESNIVSQMQKQLKKEKAESEQNINFGVTLNTPGQPPVVVKKAVTVKGKQDISQKVEVK